MGFQEFLKTKGFMDFRCVIVNKECTLVPNNDNSFSTTVNGGLDIRYIKDNIEIIWGLGEYNLPPTLLFPRLNIRCPSCHPFTSPQNLVNRCLSEYSNEEIFEALINNTILNIN